MTVIMMEFEVLKSRLVKASKAMEKTELVELHKLRMRDFDETGNDWQLTSEEKDEMLERMSTEAKLSKHQFLPLEELKRISLLELTLETRHEGRVLYGTLCVEAFFLNFVQTLVEDDDGKVMTVIIDDPDLDCDSSWGKVKIRYCEGAKVAIKEPYLSSLPDTSLVLYVNTEDDIEILSETLFLPSDVSPWSKLDAADLRTEGNRFFAKEDWVGAIDLYSKCIMKSMETLRSKPPPKPRRKKGSVAANGGGSPFLGMNRLGFSDPETVMLAYSNRAAAWMKLRHFEKALIDSGEALKLDPTHLKSIYRKGRALHGLQQYEQACETFQSALSLSAHDKDIKVALQRSKTCDLQSRLGLYEISKYILGTCDGGTTTECSDYVGPVEIKWCEKLGRRGLFVTTDVDVGELLLVSNALSVVRVDGTNPKKVEGPSGRSNMLLRDELLFKLFNLALKSPKWLHQMSFLSDSENQEEEKCPPMDLFKPNRTWDAFSLHDMPLARIKGVVLQNAFDESGSCARGLHNNRLPGENNRQFLGLWALPSFVNHSCCPNSVRLHLGDTLFLHASRQLEAGEEVTISYVNSLLPLPMRRELLIQDRWEFQCRCSRCELELRLRDPLKHICKRVYDLWGTKDGAVAGHPQSLIMAKNALNVEHQLKLHTLYLQERQLIRGSYFNAYWSAYLNLDQLGNHALSIPPPETMVDAMNMSSPGDPMNLYFAAYWLKKFEEQGATKAVIKDAQRRAMHICKCMYGKQKSEVLKRLIKAHAAG
jgi:tetratricopeptide (TPR) repeat protein